jgi:predicted amidohydrolase YtcJ
MASPILRWGFTLSALVIAIVYALRQQQPLVSFKTTATTTHCYASIRTLWDEEPSPRCFNVTDGKFSAIFTPETLPDHIHPGHVIPGLWDGHGHLRQYGEFLHSVDLFGSQSLEEVRVRLKKYLAKNPSAGTKHEWVRGIGWDQTFFGRMPTAV